MSMIETRNRLAEKVDQYEHLLKSGSYSQARAASLKGEVDRLESQLKAQEEFEARFGVTPAEWATPEQRTQAESMERAAFEICLRKHEAGKDTTNYLPRNLRTYAPLTDGTTAGGAFLVPTSIGSTVNMLIKSYGPLLKYVNAITTDGGGKMNWPTLDGTGTNGVFINENDPTSQQDTNTNGLYGNAVLGSIQWQSGIILASNGQVQDNAFGLADLILKEAAQRAARGFVDRVTNGDGSTTGVVHVSGTGDLTQTTPTAILWSEIIDLEGKVDSGYAERGAYCFNFKTYRALRKLQISGVNQWDAAEFSQGRINNHPYFINNALPDIGSGNKAVGFGDWSQVIFRQVGSMAVAVLREVFQSNLQVGYLMNQRVDSIVQQPSALAFLHGA